MKGITYEDMRPGSYQVKPRLEDMDVNHLEASLCFPTFPRFCGQTFLEAKDKELALLCVRAYNDWMVEEWAAESGGRLIPLTLIPCGTPRWRRPRCAATPPGASGPCASARSRPTWGCPSVHDPDGYWDPFFQACAETSTVVNMHIGSSSKMPSTSADAPPAVGSTLTHTNATFSTGRLPLLRGAGAVPRSQAGLLGRPDRLDSLHPGKGGHGVGGEPGVGRGGRQGPRAALDVLRDHVFGCFFDDAHGLKSVDEIGVDNITYESDYPHSDSTWPHTRQIAEEQMADLTDDERRKIVRGNAITLFGLDFRP